MNKKNQLIKDFDSLLQQIQTLTEEIGDGEVVDLLTDHIKANPTRKEQVSSIKTAYELALSAHELKRLWLGSVLTQANDDTIFLLLDFIQTALRAVNDFEEGREPPAHVMKMVKEYGPDHLETVIHELINRTSDYRHEIEDLTTHNSHT